MRNKLIELRGERTQKEMADRYQVTQQCWARWEHGETTPNLTIMQRIASEANMTIEEIFLQN